MIRPRLDPPLVDAALDALEARSPSDRARREGDGWVVRDEVPWFLLFAAVALVLLAAIAHTGAARAAGYPRALRPLPWLMDAGWLASLAGFLRRYWGAFSFALRERSLVFTWTFRGRALREVSVDPEDVQAVRVLSDRTVTLEGPRNQVIASPFRAGALDPPWLARWIADAVVALGERALAR